MMNGGLCTIVSSYKSARVLLRPVRRERLDPQPSTSPVIWTIDSSPELSIEVWAHTTRRFPLTLRFATSQPTFIVASFPRHRETYWLTQVVGLRQ